MVLLFHCFRLRKDLGDKAIQPAQQIYVAILQQSAE